MDGKREARKRETADAHMQKGEKVDWWTFEIINYVLYHFILQKLLKINYKNIVKKQFQVQKDRWTFTLYSIQMNRMNRCTEVQHLFT